MLLDYEDREAIRVMGFWGWLWAGTLYRPFQRWAHRHNWHHVRQTGPFEDGVSYLVCDWCGLNHRKTPPHPLAVTMAQLAEAQRAAEGKDGRS